MSKERIIKEGSRADIEKAKEEARAFSNGMGLIFPHLK